MCMGLGFWTDDRIEILKRAVAEGFSCSEIAAHLGNGCTRNGVIGKATRLKLEWPNKPHCVHSRTRRQVASDGNTAKRMRKLMTSGGPAILPVAPLPEEPAPPSSEHNCGLMDLANHSCRWPIGDPGTEGFCFCGSPTADLENKLPYCAHHAGMARGPAARSFNTAKSVAESARFFARTMNYRHLNVVEALP